jgi:hypothetical protein
MEGGKPVTAGCRDMRVIGSGALIGGREGGKGARLDIIDAVNACRPFFENFATGRVGQVFDLTRIG